MREKETDSDEDMIEYVTQKAKHDTLPPLATS